MNDMSYHDTGSEQIKEKKVKIKFGINWNKNNINTLKTWLIMAMQQIDILDNATQRYKNLIRFNVIWGLILSTASGTISASNINISSLYINFAFSIVFTTLSFFIAIGSGMIKIWQIQENLECYIKLKQDWTIFCIKIIAQLNLRRENRIDATVLINENNNKYLELLKTDIDISKSIKRNSEKELTKYLNNLLSNKNQNNLDSNINLLSSRDLQTIIKNSIYKLHLEFKFLDNKNELSQFSEEKIAVILSGYHNVEPNNTIIEKNTLLKNEKCWCCCCEINCKYSCLPKIFYGFIKMCGSSCWKFISDPCHRRPIKKIKIPIETHIIKYNLGEKIKVNYLNTGIWYEGYICKINYNDNIYDVDYMDGEREYDISYKRIRKQYIPLKYNIDDKVEVNYNKNGTWTQGIVFNINYQKDISFDIIYSDGNVEKEISEEMIRPIKNIDTTDEIISIDDILSTENIKSTETKPIETKSIKNTTENTTSTENTPIKNTSTENTSTENTTTENTSIENTSIENTPIENTPIENTSIENTSIENTSIENTSIENTIITENIATLETTVISDNNSHALKNNLEKKLSQLQMSSENNSHTIKNNLEKRLSQLQMSLDKKPQQVQSPRLNRQKLQSKHSRSGANFYV
jgi:hypothetical protein